MPCEHCDKLARKVERCAELAQVGGPSRSKRLASLRDRLARWEAEHEHAEPGATTAHERRAAHVAGLLARERERVAQVKAERAPYPFPVPPVTEAALVELSDQLARNTGNQAPDATEVRIDWFDGSGYARISASYALDQLAAQAGKRGAARAVAMPGTRLLVVAVRLGDGIELLDAQGQPVTDAQAWALLAEVLGDTGDHDDDDGHAQPPGCEWCGGKGCPTCSAPDYAGIEGDREREP